MQNLWKGGQVVRDKFITGIGISDTSNWKGQVVRDKFITGIGITDKLIRGAGEFLIIFQSPGGFTTLLLLDFRLAAYKVPT